MCNRFHNQEITVLIYFWRELTFPVKEIIKIYREGEMTQKYKLMEFLKG